MHPTFRKLMATAVIGMTLGAGSAWAQKEMNDPFREPALAALRGKTIAYLPISLGFDLAQAWGGVIKQEADRYGMTSLIAQKPDVIVTQNPDLQSLARLLKQANAAGIHVIQMNMQGAVQTDA